MRVNAVRQAWRFRHPDTLLTPGFYDSSLWESRQREGDESVVCVKFCKSRLVM